MFGYLYIGVTLSAPSSRAGWALFWVVLPFAVFGILGIRSFAAHLRSELLQWKWARWKEAEANTPGWEHRRGPEPVGKGNLPPGEMHFVFCTIGLGLLPPLRALAIPAGRTRCRKAAGWGAFAVLALLTGGMVVTRTMGRASLASWLLRPLLDGNSGEWYAHSFVAAATGVIFEVGLMILLLPIWRAAILRIHCRLLPRITVSAVRLARTASAGMVVQFLLGWIVPINLLFLAACDDPRPHALKDVIPAEMGPVMWVFLVGAAVFCVLIAAGLTAFTVRRNVRIIARLTAMG